MPKNGTATNTEIASADVVESEPVGASYPGMIAQRLDTAMNRNKVPDKPEILLRMVQAHLLDLFLNRGDHDFKEALPARDVHFGRELARDQPRPDGHHEHQRPGRDDRAIEHDKAVPPENQLIGSKAQLLVSSSNGVGSSAGSV